MDYSYIIIPVIVAIASQIIKLLTDGIKGNFDFKNFLTFYGGMPSSHTAFAVSITTLVGLRVGIDTPVFGVALVFTLLIMRDALAFRNILGQQSKLFNRYRDTLPAESQKDLPRLREQMGHSWSEVTVGAIFGIVATWILTLI